MSKNLRKIQSLKERNAHFYNKFNYFQQHDEKNNSNTKKQNNQVKKADVQEASNWGNQDMGVFFIKEIFNKASCFNFCQYVKLGLPILCKRAKDLDLKLSIIFS